METQDSLLDSLFEQKQQAVLLQTQKAFKDIIEREMELFEFELFNAVAISETQSKKTIEEVRAIRKQRWKEAITKSNGDTERALKYF